MVCFSSTDISKRYSCCKRREKVTGKVFLLSVITAVQIGSNVPSFNEGARGGGGGPNRMGFPNTALLFACTRQNSSLLCPRLVPRLKV